MIRLSERPIHYPPYVKRSVNLRRKDHYTNEESTNIKKGKGSFIQSYFLIYLDFNSLLVEYKPIVLDNNFVLNADSSTL